MRIGSKSSNISLYVSVAFLICVISIELLCILCMNNGLLVYTLDDAYIHLALAENIRVGHYGINASEFSAPSSSILWPFILAPLSMYEYSPFLINVVCAVATVLALVKMLTMLFNIDGYVKHLCITAVCAFSILALNIVGLVFTGMEHSLQVLLVIVIAYGLIIEIEKGKVRWWLLVAIVVAPLIRYECLAISLPSVMYLALNRHIKCTIIALVSLALLLCGFSIFLISLGLEPLPTSVFVKSSVVQSGGAIRSVMRSLRISLICREGVILWIGGVSLLLHILLGEGMKRKRLAAVALSAVFVHFMAGRYGAYHRYEIYILSFTVVAMMYVFLPSIRENMTRNKQPNYISFLTMMTIMGVALVIGEPYVQDLFTIPNAANNIYEQQYQMHRFAVDYYRMAVAVNDLGYVSYKNPNYVLDLWGVGSHKALGLRLNSKSSIWMKQLTEEHNIGLAMIYEHWFTRYGIPDEWIKIGELHLGKRTITPDGSKVAFYSTRKIFCQDIKNKLYFFVKTLPSDVKFTFEENGS